MPLWQARHLSDVAKNGGGAPSGAARDARRGSDGPQHDGEGNCATAHFLPTFEGAPLVPVPEQIRPQLDVAALGPVHRNQRADVRAGCACGDSASPASGARDPRPRRRRSGQARGRPAPRASASTCGRTGSGPSSTPARARQKISGLAVSKSTGRSAPACACTKAPAGSSWPHATKGPKTVTPAPRPRSARPVGTDTSSPNERMVPVRALCDDRVLEGGAEIADARRPPDGGASPTSRPMRPRGSGLRTGRRARSSSARRAAFRR